jgi:hypothetical protein
MMMSEPSPNPVPGVGHFNRTLLGHFWRAAKLMQGESSLPGEWEYLSAFRARKEQAPPEDFGIRRSLLHRQIIREENGRWRLRVPLMARWLRLRG